MMRKIVESKKMERMDDEKDSGNQENGRDG